MKINRVISIHYDYSCRGGVIASEIRRYWSEKGRNIALAHFLRKGFFVEALEPNIPKIIVEDVSGAKYEIEGGPGEYNLYIKGTIYGGGNNALLKKQYH